MKIVLYTMRFLFLSLVGLFFYSVAYGQSKSGGFGLLEVLPAITFILALTTGMLNLYIMNKLGKNKEEILTIVRLEFKTELHELEGKMATKEQLEFARKELMYMLKSIEDKIDISAKRDKKIDDRDN